LIHFYKRFNFIFGAGELCDGDEESVKK